MRICVFRVLPDSLPAMECCHAISIESRQYDLLSSSFHAVKIERRIEAFARVIPSMYTLLELVKVASKATDEVIE